MEMNLASPEIKPEHTHFCYDCNKNINLVDQQFKGCKNHYIEDAKTHWKEMVKLIPDSAIADSHSKQYEAYYSE